MKVYLSPSVQDKNIGASAYGSEELRMNQLVDIMIPALESYGVEVFRNKPTMTLKQLADDSDSNDVDLHFAIHSNASGTHTAKGTSIYIFSKSPEAMKFASLVYNSLSTLTPWSDRGIVVEPGFYELKYTNAWAALVEIDFHDNKQSAEWILANMNLIAKSLVESILNYFGIPIIREPEWETVCRTKLSMGDGWIKKIRNRMENPEDKLDNSWDAFILKISK